MGLATIIFAHAGPPDILFQLRNYDVPLMVLVSGMSFALAFKPQESYAQYVWKRVKRLALPTWIFLAGYFAMLALVRPGSEDLARETIRNSFLLLSGIGFVWIIRVFLLVALVSPVIYKVFQKRKSDNLYVLGLLVAFAAYEIGMPLVEPYIPGRFINEISAILFYVVPYALVFGLGLMVPKLSVKKNALLGVFFMAVFGAIAASLIRTQGTFVWTQQFKYPPTTYYFSYAVGVSIFLWIASDWLWSLVEKTKPVEGLVLFIAQNSMWIYLWHIPLVKALPETLFFGYRFVLLLAIATAITWLQSWAVHNVLMAKTQNVQIKKNLRSLLTG